MKRFVALTMLMTLGFPVFGQGLPPEARANIHHLMEHHAEVPRELTWTGDGYQAVTHSTNSTVAAALQAHVTEMKDRLDRGLAVRRWDPAFAEYDAYSGQMDFTLEKIPSGVKVTVHGQTPEGVRVAQNHAVVINEFVSDGWRAYERSHPPVLDVARTDSRPGVSRGQCSSGKGGKGRRGVGCRGGCGSRQGGKADN